MRGYGRNLMMSSIHPIRSFALDNLLLFALGHLEALPSKRSA